MGGSGPRIEAHFQNEQWAREEKQKTKKEMKMTIPELGLAT